MLKGLAFPSLSVQKIPSFVTLLKESNQIPSASFSVLLTSNDESLEGSRMILGGINPNYAASEFVYHKIVPPGGWWLIEMNGLSVGDVRITFDRYIQAMVDTGKFFFLLF